MESFDLRTYDDVTVAVVIPARNEEATITDAVRRAKQFAHDVLVMDGHSTDETATRAREAGARVVLDPGLGKGSAPRASLEVIVIASARGTRGSCVRTRPLMTIVSASIPAPFCGSGGRSPGRGVRSAAGSFAAPAAAARVAPIPRNCLRVTSDMPAPVRVPTSCGAYEGAASISCG